MYGKVIPWLCNRVLDGNFHNYIFFHYFFYCFPIPFTFFKISIFDLGTLVNFFKKYVNKNIRCNILVFE